MIADIRQFIGNIQNGFLKPSRFTIGFFVPPAFFGAYDSSFMLDEAQQLSFACTNVTLPGVDIATLPIRPYGVGPTEKRPFAPQFGECQLAVNNDADAAAWTFFKKWIEIIVYFNSSRNLTQTNRTLQDGSYMQPYEVGYKDDYIIDALITFFSDVGEPVLQVALKESFPVSLSNIRGDWGQTDQISTFGVALSYRDFYQVDQDAQTLLGATNNNFVTPVSSS